jgi:hypothetical protein
MTDVLNRLTMQPLSLFAKQVWRIWRESSGLWRKTPAGGSYYLFTPGTGFKSLLPSSEKEMNGTAQQYTQRILGYVDGKHPLAVQASTARKLERLIKGVSIAKLRKRPAPNKWSVSEIVAHLADGEIVGSYRLRLILGSPGAAVVAYDQDQWVISGHYENRDPRKSVEQFRVLREWNLALLKSLKAEQWKHYGMHSERGRESIDQIVRMFAGHDINHLQQMEKILSRR